MNLTMKDIEKAMKYEKKIKIASPIPYHEIEKFVECFRNYLEKEEGIKIYRGILK